MNLKGLGEWWREKNRKLGGKNRKLEVSYRREKENSKEFKEWWKKIWKKEGKLLQDWMKKGEKKKMEL